MQPGSREGSCAAPTSVLITFMAMMPEEMRERRSGGGCSTSCGGATFLRAETLMPFITASTLAVRRCHTHEGLNKEFFLSPSSSKTRSTPCLQAVCVLLTSVLQLVFVHTFSYAGIYKQYHTLACNILCSYSQICPGLCFLSHPYML